MAACGAGSGPAPQARHDFIAADEVAWDYAPLGHDGITGAPFDDVANTYVQSGPQRIGKTAP